MSKGNALETVQCYKEMETSSAGSSILREVKWQYADMAKGGDGGFLWSTDDGKEVNCREHNYPGYPDSFFQKVCTLMDWSW